jgi:hypothetical protein
MPAAHYAVVRPGMQGSTSCPCIIFQMHAKWASHKLMELACSAGAGVISRGILFAAPERSTLVSCFFTNCGANVAYTKMLPSECYKNRTQSGAYFVPITNIQNSSVRFALRQERSWSRISRALVSNDDVARARHRPTRPS